tara:strand:+ start:1461 stop:3218 length:1758 start_codon:yes stop_codon:yes gene_type:complete
MNYLLPLSIIFILLSYSNFINLRFKIKLHETILVIICSIIIFSYLLLQLQGYYDLTLLNYIYLILLLPTIILLPYIIKNNSKINKKLNLEIILIFIIIFFLSNDRYYLDQDEFTYWGKALKAFTLNLNEISFAHHPNGLNLFRNLFIFNGYEEGIIIFSNNVILISGFVYLFYDRELTIIEKIIIFSIYYLLVNNLSFGFLSIYSDPILAILYACLLKKSFLMFKNENSKKEFNFLLIFFTLFLINRSAPIYAIIILYFCLSLFYLNQAKRYKHSLLIFLFTLIFFTYIIYLTFIPIVLRGDYSLDFSFIISILLSSNIFTQQLIDFLVSPIYFSHFGVTLNSIFETILLTNFRIFEFQIPIIVYIIFLTSFIFFKFKYRKFLIFTSFLIIFTYMIIILILKVNIDNLHLSAVPRYIGIMILGKYLFFISLVISENKLINKNLFFLFLLLCLFIVTPKKTLGFFATDKVYYSNVSNLNFKKNREVISKLKNFKNDFDKILVIHKENYSDLTNIFISGEHTFYHNIIEYELFPKIPNFIELTEYLSIKDSLEQNNTLIISFDLPEGDLSKINKDINFFKIDTHENN